jgi:hypothetical protein
LRKIEYVVSVGKVNPKRAHAKHIFSFLEQKFNIKFSFAQPVTPLADESKITNRNSNPKKKP